MSVQLSEKQHHPLQAASIMLPKKPRKPSKPSDKVSAYDEKMKLYNERIAQYPKKLKEYETWMSTHANDIKQYHLYQKLIYERHRQRHRCRKARVPINIEGLV